MDSRSICLDRALRIRWLRDDNLASGLQLIKTAGCYHFPWIDSRDGGDAVVRNAGGDVAYACHALRNHIKECHRAIVLNGCCGNKCHSLLRVDKQPGVHKLVGEQRSIPVVEESP